MLENISIATQAFMKILVNFSPLIVIFLAYCVYEWHTERGGGNDIE